MLLERMIRIYLATLLFLIKNNSVAK